VIKKKPWPFHQTEIARKPAPTDVRNRERVLEAAKAVFSAGGSEASLEAVARHAGVGIGTLYRHFRPARRSMKRSIAARSSSSAILPSNWNARPERSRRCGAGCAPMSNSVATKKGMVAALALVAHGSTELHAYSFDRLTRAIGTLLARAVAAGEIRGDISADDVLRALIGMCYMHDQPGWQSTALRLLDVFVDGLRVRAAGKVVATKETCQDENCQDESQSQAIALASSAA